MAVAAAWVGSEHASESDLDPDPGAPDPDPDASDPDPDSGVPDSDPDPGILVTAAAVAAVVCIAGGGGGGAAAFNRRPLMAREVAPNRGLLEAGQPPVGTWAGASGAAAGSHCRGWVRKACGGVPGDSVPSPASCMSTSCS